MSRLAGSNGFRQVKYVETFMLFRTMRDTFVKVASLERIGVKLTGLPVGQFEFRRDGAVRSSVMNFKHVGDE